MFESEQPRFTCTPYQGAAAVRPAYEEYLEESELTPEAGLCAGMTAFRRWLLANEYRVDREAALESAEAAGFAPSSAGLFLDAVLGGEETGDLLLLSCWYTLALNHRARPGSRVVQVRVAATVFYEDGTTIPVVTTKLCRPEHAEFENSDGGVATALAGCFSEVSVQFLKTGASRIYAMCYESGRLRPRGVPASVSRLFFSCVGALWRMPGLSPRCRTYFRALGAQVTMVTAAAELRADDAAAVRLFGWDEPPTGRKPPWSRRKRRRPPGKTDAGTRRDGGDSA